MKARLFILWEKIRASYWFLPAVMVIGAVLFLQFSLFVDALPAFKDLAQSSWFRFGSTGAAREILATISGALIALIATVFTLTMVVLTLASSHYGILLLRRLMKDRTTQFTLGVFIATFVYCLLTLRSIQQDNSDQSFLPHLSINIALVLTLASMVFLICFIHHIATQIQAPAIINHLNHDFLQSIHVNFTAIAAKTEKGVYGDTRFHSLKSKFETIDLRAPKDGYVQAIDYEGIVLAAAENDLEAELTAKVGDFKMQGQPLGALHGKAELSEETLKKINGGIILGPLRTAEQDVRFAAEQMIEVVLRALSPGINEVLVANMCINHLSACLFQAAKLSATPRSFYDPSGHLRLACPQVTFEELFTITFGTILHDAAQHPTTLAKLKEQTIAIGAGLPVRNIYPVLNRFIEEIDALTAHSTGPAF